jgi:hypothetical protein
VPDRGYCVLNDNPQPRVDLTDVGQKFMEKHLTGANGALFTALGEEAAQLCIAAIPEFNGTPWKADKKKGGEMTGEDKCNSLKAFFCGDDEATCLAKSLFAYAGHGWNFGSYSVKSNRGPNLEVVIEARHMENAHIGEIYQNVHKHIGKGEDFTISKLAPLVDDIRKAWNYDGDEGEDGVCAPDQARGPGENLSYEEHETTTI